MRIDPAQHGWMTAPETAAVMTAPRRAGRPKPGHEDCKGSAGRLRATKQKNERGHED
jgi:hypothetical protein